MRISGIDSELSRAPTEEKIKSSAIPVEQYCHSIIPTGQCGLVTANGSDNTQHADCTVWSTWSKRMKVRRQNTWRSHGIHLGNGFCY